MESGGPLPPLSGRNAFRRLAPISDQRPMMESFDQPEAAMIAMARLLRTKRRRGYRE